MVNSHFAIGLKPSVFGCINNAIAPPLIALESCLNPHDHGCNVSNDKCGLKSKQIPCKTYCRCIAMGCLCLHFWFIKVFKLIAISLTSKMFLLFTL